MIVTGDGRGTFYVYALTRPSPGHLLVGSKTTNPSLATHAVAERKD